MTQAESARSRKIMAALRLKGYFCFKVHGSETMMSGLPDVIVCAEGYFIGLETKMPAKYGNTSAIQDLRHDQIRAAGGECHVVVSVQDALDTVAQALKDLKNR